jgi:hypothetical protein
VTPTQMQTLNATLRRVETKLDAIEERLAYVYPTEREMRSQIDAEIDSILGVGVRVFDE